MQAPALLLVIDNNAGSVAAALDRIEAFLDGAGYGPDVCGRVMVVADEIVSNVARCAFPADERHSFTLAFTPEPGEGLPQLRLLVEDAGIPFDPTAADSPDLDLPLGQRESGGLGTHLVRCLSRSVSYTRQDGLNRLTVLLDAGQA